MGSFPHHQVRLNIAARADIIWWHTFVDSWNGLSLLWSVGRCSPNILVVSDASGSWGCRESHLMHLIRVLVFLASHLNFWFTASHVAGDSNILADALSRNNVDLFLSEVPQAHRHSSRIPPPLIDLLVCNITWTSTVWTKLFRDTLQLL